MNTVLVLTCLITGLHEIIDLSRCQALQTLDLRVLDSDRTLASSVISCLLSRVNSPDMRKLTLHVNFASSDPSKDYITMITGFEETPLKDIPQVSFVYEGCLCIGTAERKLRKAFHQLDVRGVMSVECICKGRCSSTGCDLSILDGKCSTNSFVSTDIIIVLLVFDPFNPNRVFYVRFS